MTVRELELPGVVLIEPRVFRDDRGRFLESYHRQRYRALGLAPDFVQDNVSVSRRGVLRGIHYQNPHAQGKLVTVLHGAVFDVAVDLRRGSRTFGRWTAVELTSDNCQQLWIPPGFGHGFQVLSDEAVFAYKCTEYYVPDADRCIRWDDPEIDIHWPVADPVLSDRDASAPVLAEVPPEHLFDERSCSAARTLEALAP